MTGSRAPLQPGVQWRFLLGTASAASVAVPFLVFDGFPSGDLHSHAYNAWLARLIRQGQAPGLHLVPLWTNALVDAWLDHLLGFLSPRWAETVVLLVLAQGFLWSAFLFCRSLSGRPCWEWLPVLAALGVGWTFHMGFANWYAAAAISLLAGGIALSPLPTVWRIAGAGPLLALACLANPLPTAWMAGGLTLAMAIRRWPGQTLRWTALAVSGVAATGALLRITGGGEYRGSQFAFATGADQLLVFDGKFVAWMIALLVLWAGAIRAWLRQPARRSLPAPALGVAVLASATVIFLPDLVHFPAFSHPVVFLAERNSLLAGVAWTAVAAMAPPSRWRGRAILLLWASWLLVLSADWSRLSRFQVALDDAVARLPASARVVSTLATPGSRVQPFTHSVARSCIDRCFAWGNYEASTGVFRVRARPGNAIVVSRRGDAAAIEMGRYEVPELPFALWKVVACEAPAQPAAPCLAPARTGEVVGLWCVHPFLGSGRAADAACRDPE